MQPDSYVQRGELTSAKWILLTLSGLDNRDRKEVSAEKKKKKKVCIGWVVAFLGKNRCKSIFIFIFYFVEAPGCYYLNQNIFYCLKIYCCKIQLYVM